ncbi:MAG TPA: hypothetical protein VF665_15045 [Longimicrobium sp.]|jgi:hypothetical protein|uniref:hypothetical protein n=1 Tax=Longimicrobium sp. TaxID=2029185 RepID=UPI002ED84D40
MAFYETVIFFLAKVTIGLLMITTVMLLREIVLDELEWRRTPAARRDRRVGPRDRRAAAHRG